MKGLSEWVKRDGHNDLTGYAGEFVTWEQKVRVSKDTWNKILTCSLLPTSLLKNSCSILLQHLLFRLWTQVINKTRLRTTLFWVWRKGKSGTTQLYVWNSDVVSQLRLTYKFYSQHLNKYDNPNNLVSRNKGTDRNCWPSMGEVFHSHSNFH